MLRILISPSESMGKICNKSAAYPQHKLTYFRFKICTTKSISARIPCRFFFLYIDVRSVAIPLIYLLDQADSKWGNHLTPLAKAGNSQKREKHTTKDGIMDKYFPAILYTVNFSHIFLLAIPHMATEGAGVIGVGCRMCTCIIHCCCPQVSFTLSFITSITFITRIMYKQRKNYSKRKKVEEQDRPLNDVL